MERNARMERRVGGCTVVGIRRMRSSIPRDMSCVDSYQTVTNR